MPSEKQFYFYQKWLTYANVFTLGVGLLVAFAGNSIVFELSENSKIWESLVVSESFAINPSCLGHV